MPQYNIYIEHFGVDEDWNVPDWFKGKEDKTAKELYNDGIAWKREQHKMNNTRLIETYSWQQKKGILLENLKKQLEAVGVIFKPKTEEEMWEVLQVNAKREFNEFTQLINTFLVLMKSNNEDILSLREKAAKEDNDRAKSFLDLVEPIFIAYVSYLYERDEIDFSDMINKANNLVSSNQYISDWDYIIIDEFQDISNSRFQLIKSLLDQKPSTKLFCVGDDWQSIFRFAGSDIGLFTSFSEKFKSSTALGFERTTVTTYIQHTYRFDNQLIKLTSDFILQNPNQIKKNIKSNLQSSSSPFTIITYSDPKRDGSNVSLSISGALNLIYEKNKNQQASVLLVGRYSYEAKNLDRCSDLKKIWLKDENDFFYRFRNTSNLEIRFLTAHRAKGLEADFVVILNCSSGTFGFPSEISDDPLLNFLLSESDQFPNGEERRLFYVAMTRAKKHVYFLVNSEYPSKFISEIVPDQKQTSSLKCAWCDVGQLIQREGPYGAFYACDNYLFCNYTEASRN